MSNLETDPAATESLQGSKPPPVEGDLPGAAAGAAPPAEAPGSAGEGTEVPPPPAQGKGQYPQGRNGAGDKPAPEAPPNARPPEGETPGAVAPQGKPEHEGTPPSPPPAPAPEAGAKGEKARKGAGKEGFESEGTGEPELTPLIIEKIKEVYMPWPGLEKDCKNRGENPERLVVVVGEPGSGRFTTAVWAGMQMLPRHGPEAHKIVALSQTMQTGPELMDWMRSSHRQRRTVYVLDQPLGTRFAFSTLTESLLTIINQRLGDLDSWLFLTAKPAESRESDALIKPLHMTRLDKGELQKVLDRHLAWLHDKGPELDLGSWKTHLIDEVRARTDAGVLATPPQIVRLLSQLPELLRRGGLDDEQERSRRVKILADEVARGVTQSWFDRLSANEKLLALLVEAFRGTPQADVEETYVSASDRLREADPLFRDPRRFSFDDMYRRISVEPITRLVWENQKSRAESGGPRNRLESARRSTERAETRYLEFTHENYRAEVLRQMQNRHHLLWGVVESVGGSKLSTMILPWQAPQRQALGEVIARIGIHRPRDLKKLMYELLLNESAIIASMPGYILRGICLLDDPDHDFVCRELRGWVQEDPGDFDHAWGATAAVWRVYCELGRQRTALMADKTRATDKLRRLESALAQLEEIITQVARSGVIATDDDDDDHDHDADVVADRVAEKLAEDDREDEFPAEADFLSYALERMFQELPQSVGRLTQRWLEAGGKLKSAGRRAAIRLYAINQDVESLVPARFEALLALVGAVLKLDRAVVDDVLLVMLEWSGQDELRQERQRQKERPDELRQERQRQKERPDELLQGAGGLLPQIARALFTACNRASEGERLNLRRSMSTLWLRSPSARARDIAHAVICRARLLDGIPVEMAGAGSAVLMVDGSEAGQQNDTANRLTQQIFEFLSPQVDLWVVQPGSSRELARPGHTLEVEQLPSRDPVPRIVMPWIEKLRSGGTGARGGTPLHFVCVVHWARLVDDEDAEECTDVPFIPILISGHHLPRLQTSSEMDLLPFASAIRLMGKLSDRINEEQSENLLVLAGTVLGVRLSKILAGRSPDEWWEALAPLLPPCHETGLERRQIARQRLEECISRLDEVWSCAEGEGGAAAAASASAAGSSSSDGATHTDPLRAGLGLVQWFAAGCLEEVVDLLCECMNRRTRSPRGNFAAGAAGMLLRLHSVSMLETGAGKRGPVPPVQRLLPLLELAPALARYRSGQGVQALLEALRCWVGDESWAATLRWHTALSRMVTEAPSSLRDKIRDWSAGLAEGAIEALGEKRAPASVHALHLRLKCALLLRLTKKVSLKGTVLVLWHDSGHPRSLHRLGRLAWQLYLWAEAARDRRESNAPSFVFLRVGSGDPVGVSGDGVQGLEAAFTTAKPGPAILYPVLETLALAAGQIILMADGLLPDAEDWLDPEALFVQPASRQRLRLFWDNRAEPHPHLAGSPPWQPEWTSLSEMSDSQALECVRQKIAMNLLNDEL